MCSNIISSPKKKKKNYLISKNKCETKVWGLKKLYPSTSNTRQRQTFLFSHCELFYSIQLNHSQQCISNKRLNWSIYESRHIHAVSLYLNLNDDEANRIQTQRSHGEKTSDSIWSLVGKYS